MPASERVMEVSDLYAEVIAHLESEFGTRRPRWVRGEIEKYYEKNHLYLDVVDTTPGADTQRPVLKVRCWQGVWGRLKRELLGQGVTLKEGAVITFCGYLNVYKARGELSFIITEIDTEGLVGDVARRRQALIDQLAKEGALEANGRLPMPPVPLRVGLVASPNTEGFRDFTGQLVHSGLSFHVAVVPSTVQGEAAPEEIARAIGRLSASDVDVICLVRGGGSRGDLAAFDDERVARAIVAATKPVLTGVGHTGDTSVADLVASHAAITPTKLGEHLVDLVAGWREDRVRRPAERLSRATAAIIEEAREYVDERRRTVVFAVRDRLGTEVVRLSHRRESLGRHAAHLLERETRHLATTKRLFAAYDPQRRLAQGWAIVTTPNGAVVRRVADTAVGEALTVRVADGRIATVVTGKESDGEG